MVGMLEEVELEGDDCRKEGRVQKEWREDC